jgi:hypothetical protein
MRFGERRLLYSNQIAAANTNASAQTYNTAQVQSQRARFTSAMMKKDESVEVFAERLRQLACGLPETTTDDVLLLQASRLWTSLREWTGFVIAKMIFIFSIDATQSHGYILLRAS